MLKLLLGLLKGAVVGGLIGLGAFKLDLSGGLHWLTYGLAGALVGLIAGRPLWALITDKEGTTWVSVLKALFGFGVGCGLYALASNFLTGVSFSFQSETRVFHDWQPAFAAAVGGFLGAFFEIDDAIGGEPKKAAPAAAPALPAAKKK